jgi:peptidoglycan hydrolase CwlO-like protein
VEFQPIGEQNPNPPQAGQGEIPQALTQQLAQMIKQMKKLNENQTTMSKRIQRMSVRIKKHTESIKSLDEVQTDLVKICVRYFGASNASPSRVSQEEDEDDEEDDEDDAMEDADVDAQDGDAPN